MAFRRRRFVRGQKKAPLRLTWVNSVFVATGIASDATALSAQVLLTAADWGGNQEGLAKPCFVRRVLVSFGFTVDLDYVSSTEQRGGIIYCCVLEEDDETESTLLLTTTGQILQQNRVLHSGIQAMSLTAFTASGHMLWSPQHQVDWKGRLRVEAHQQLNMLYQNMINVDLPVTAMEVRAFARVLIEQP